MGNDLNKQDLEVLIMKEQYGLSYSAIAKNLGITKSAARSIYNRAKNRERVTYIQNDPNKVSFKQFAKDNLEPSTYKALMNAKIESYYDFIKMDTLDLIMLKGVGPSKLVELTNFKEKIISYMKIK